MLLDHLVTLPPGCVAVMDRRDDYDRDEGSALPWARGGSVGGDNDRDYNQGGGYGGPLGGGCAPW